MPDGTPNNIFNKESTMRLSVLEILLLLATIAAMESAAVAGEPFALAFEGNLTNASGQAPIEAAKVTFAPGKSGQAGVFGKKSQLAYPTRGNYDPQRGTVEMWVRRQWGDTKSDFNRIFWEIQSDKGQENRTYLSFLGTGSQGYVCFFSGGWHHEVKAMLVWKKDTWHHLMACWDDKLHCRALYVDGEFRGACRSDRDMPSTQSAFHVGYAPKSGRGAMAAIDEFKLHAAIAPADFLEKTKNTEAHLKTKAQWVAIAKRLDETYSFDRVEKERIEVKQEDLLGLPTALTKRVPIQACYHPEVVMVHPDLSITLGRQPESLALGFALGDEATLPDMYTVTRKLHNGYQPIVESRWESGPLAIEQTAFCILPDDETVAKGTEKQYVVVRMKLTNTGNKVVENALLLMVGRAHDTQCANYLPFVPSFSRWREESLGVKAQGQSLVLGDRVLLSHRSGMAAPAAFNPVLKLQSAAKGRPESFNNCMKFPVRLEPNESRNVDLVVAGTSDLYSMASCKQMAALDYDKALQRAETHWDRLLEPGMKLSTPDAKLNEIYKAMILSSLQNFRNTPDRQWHEPAQSCFHLEGVWPWEFSHQAVPLASIGYHKQLEPSLLFFTQRQVGVGPHAGTKGPQGEIDSIEGCFVGNCGLYWMCETGAILNAMAGKYLYSRDDVWLKQNKPSILAAWSFIQKAREQTRKNTKDIKDGEGDIFPGLLPPGRATDGRDFKQMFGFSDNFTWNGMNQMAKAFRKAGLPEAEQMTRDADDYRQCLLKAVDRAQITDPENGLVMIPNFLSGEDGANNGRVLNNHYSIAMWQTGLLDANDPRFGDRMEWQRRKGGFLMGLSFPFPVGSSYWYIDWAAPGIYKSHLARGEYEKALLDFYTNLVYGMSQDCYQTVERVDIAEPNYAPFQSNPSGNGRFIEMARRMVIDEQEPGVLWLLRGCPRRWFAPGKTVVVENAHTLFGPMALRTSADDRTITVDIEVPAWESPREIRLLARHPRRRALKSATLNGSKCAVDNGSAGNDIVTIPNPKGHLHLVCTFEEEKQN